MVICRRGFHQPIAVFLISHWRCRTVLFLKKQHHYNRLLLATVVPSHDHTYSPRSLCTRRQAAESSFEIQMYLCLPDVACNPFRPASYHFKPARGTPFAKILTRSPHIRPPRPSTSSKLARPPEGGRTFIFSLFNPIEVSLARKAARERMGARQKLEA